MSSAVNNAPENRARPRGSTRLATLLIAGAATLGSGCAMLAPSPPQNQTNICEIFREQPRWYDYALDSQEKWGTPIATQMAFVQRET